MLLDDDQEESVEPQASSNEGGSSEFHQDNLEKSSDLVDKSPVGVNVESEIEKSPAPSGTSFESYYMSV